MDEYDHTLVSLVVVGAFIALGKMLVANEVITLRLFNGRVFILLRLWGSALPWGSPVINLSKFG